LDSALYVVATPIGNLRDITLRALEVLKRVDVVAAEDTRVTRTLLRHYEIAAPLMSLHQHNEQRAKEKVLELLGQGKRVALVSDAGTPAVSDPGALLVAHIREAGFPIVPVPGPNAAVCALSAAGLMTQGFLFYGFLPRERSRCRAELQALSALRFPLVFYEAPHRVVDTVSQMVEVFGRERRIVFARELTKLHETIHVCALGEALNWLKADENHRRGEFVLIVSGGESRSEPDEARAREVLETLLRELPLNQAARLAARLSTVDRKTLYRWGLDARA
jgi:16S rRNA (cytidine1402-2'-O)-methyltransferase